MMVDMVEADRRKNFMQTDGRTESAATMPRVLAAALVLAAIGCGDDSNGTTGSSGSGGTGAASTTTVASTAAATSSADQATSNGSGGSPGAGGEGGSNAGGSEVGAGGQGGATAASCLPADTLAVLQEHLDKMSLIAELLAGHPGVQEATGFLTAPALPDPPGVGALYASLIAPCDGEAFEYDPYCDQGTCSRIGCTGEGAGWTMTVWLEEPFEGGGFVIESAEIVNRWTEDDSGTGVTIAVEAIGPEDRDWSFNGAGRFEVDGLSLTYGFDAWVEGAPADMTWSVDADGTIGEILSGDVVVAALDEQGHFEPTGFCP
jgi:hypothetical protein